MRMDSDLSSLVISLSQLPVRPVTKTLQCILLTPHTLTQTYQWSIMPQMCPKTAGNTQLVKAIALRSAAKTRTRWGQTLRILFSAIWAQGTNYQNSSKRKCLRSSRQLMHIKRRTQSLRLRSRFLRTKWVAKNVPLKTSCNKISSFKMHRRMLQTVGLLHPSCRQRSDTKLRLS